MCTLPATSATPGWTFQYIPYILRLPPFFTFNQTMLLSLRLPWIIIHSWNKFLYLETLNQGFISMLECLFLCSSFVSLSSQNLSAHFYTKLFPINTDRPKKIWKVASFILSSYYNVLSFSKWIFQLTATIFLSKTI